MNLKNIYRLIFCGQSEMFGKKEGIDTQLFSYENEFWLVLNGFMEQTTSRLAYEINWMSYEGKL